MVVLGGLWGMEWRTKVRVQNEGRVQVKPINQLVSTVWMFGLLKEVATLAQTLASA